MSQKGQLMRASDFLVHNRGAHLRSGRRATGLTAEPSGEVPCSEARFAPRHKATNEVSAAIPPDARSASGGTPSITGGAELAWTCYLSTELIKTRECAVRFMHSLAVLDSNLLDVSRSYHTGKIVYLMNLQLELSSYSPNIAPPRVLHSSWCSQKSA